jgi:hypothetical protein
VVLKSHINLDTQAPNASYCEAYVWLVDSQATREFRGITKRGTHDGLMKLSIESLESAWFINRLKMHDDDYMIWPSTARSFRMGWARWMWYEV